MKNTILLFAMVICLLPTVSKAEESCEQSLKSVVDSGIEAGEMRQNFKNGCDRAFICRGKEERKAKYQEMLESFRGNLQNIIDTKCETQYCVNLVQNIHTLAIETGKSKFLADARFANLSSSTGVLKLKQNEETLDSQINSLKIQQEKLSAEICSK